MKTEWNGNFDVFPGKNWKSGVNLRTKISKADYTVVGMYFEFSGQCFGRHGLPSSGCDRE